MNYPILQVTGNIIIRPDKFPAGFGQKSREWVKGQLPRAFGILGKMKADIPAKILDARCRQQINRVIKK